MTLEYYLLENEYLDYYLYFDSQNVDVQARRVRGRTNLPILVTIIALLLAGYGAYKIAFSLFLFGLLWYWLYGYFQSWFYRQHFVRYVHKLFAGKVGTLARVEITDVDLQVHTEAYESKVLQTQINFIVEIPSIFVVCYKAGGSLVFPKDRIAVDALRTRLQEIANSLGIAYERKDDWEWK